MEEVLMIWVGIEPDPTYVLSTVQMVLYMGTIMLGTLMMVAGLVGDVIGTHTMLREKHWSLRLVFTLGFCAWFSSTLFWPGSLAFCVVLTATLPPIAALLAIMSLMGGWSACFYTVFVQK
jgi:hypothetical protein